MSKRKNPYESQETVDIPDFLMKKEEIEQEELIENKSRFSKRMFNQDSEDEEMSTRENRTRSIKMNEKTLMLAGGLLIALLLLALLGFIFAINKSNALKAKELEYQELAKSVNEKDLQIKKLQDEIEALKASQTSGGDIPVDNNKQTKYIVIAESVNVRSEPNTDSNENIVSSLEEGKVFTVYGDLVKDNAGRSWGKIGDKQWVCIYIDNGADGYAEEFVE